MNKKILCLALMTVVAAANASAPTQSDLQSLPYREIGVFTSANGQTLTSFLEEVRPSLRAFSDSTGFEACGEIGRSADGNRYSIELGSSLSHIGCAIYDDKVASGFVPARLSIHSHGRQGSFNASRADRILLGLSPYSDTLVPIHGQILDHFSPTDYANGAGYLAAPHSLLYQNGHPGSEIVVAG